jgi:hypothetical protein
MRKKIIIKEKISNSLNSKFRLNKEITSGKFHDAAAIGLNKLINKVIFNELKLVQDLRKLIFLNKYKLIEIPH